MKVLLFAALASAFSLPVLAKSPAKPSSQPAPVPELLEQARQEATAEGVKSKGATDAQVTDSGLLTLKDPGLNPEESPWKWVVGFRAQKFTPQGAAKMTTGQSVRLDDAGSTTYPFVELGVRRRIYENDWARWNASVRAEGGYANQENSISFASGLKAENSRLSTSLLGGSLLASVIFQRLPALELEAGYTEGMVTYAQSSANDAASFTEGGRFRGYRLGAMYWVTKEWGLGVDQARRNLTSNNNIELQSDNLSFSTRVMW